MSDLKKLVQHRDDILRAEIAGWLHNLGKLEPNFEHNYQVIRQSNELQDTLDVYHIPGQYSFRRFTEPVVLQSNFPYGDKKGVLYFIDFNKRQEREKLDNQIKELQGQLSQNPPNRAELGRQLQRLRDLKSQTQKELERAEQQQMRDYEQKIEGLMFTSGVFSSWSLGSLLTLFWEGEWFEKPEMDNYEPGSESDPDYHRKPKQHIILQHGFSMDFPLLLLLAHGEISGQEKKGVNIEGCYVELKEDQNSAANTLRISTAFGYEEMEPLVWKHWSQQRKEITDRVFAYWNDPKLGWEDLLYGFRHLCKALGDTQRPLNEISLWDYSQAIAALFKTAFVQAVLTERVPTPANMHWRLASIRLNAFDFLFEVNQLADLISRQKLLEELWNTIRTALEVETPIGSAVYRDEHGLVFVLPKGLSESGDELRQIIESRIREVILNQNGNLIGATDLRLIVQMGQPRRGKKLLLGEALRAKEPPNMPDPASVQNYWSNYQNQERCRVCGLRPVGYMEDGLPDFVTEEKAKERNLCGVCLARRGRRSEEWATRQGFKETIWIDEVADNNGRVALIVGRFDLDDWLNGNLVRSLAIGTDKEGNWLAKPPTFARIQRVWRTTAEFWQEVKEYNILRAFKDDRRRIILYLARDPDLGAYHVYELDLGKTTMSVVWCPQKSTPGGGYLISVENLGYIAQQLGQEKEVKDICMDPAAAAIWIEDFLKKEFVEGKREPVLRNPERSNRERRCNLLAGNRIVSTDHQIVAYSHAISILAEPRTFMALVPADKALEVVKAIKIKYEREMGKVRNRLPLHLGVVFAHRRMPLRSILDAGRQMLKQKALGNHDTWTVKSIVRGVLPSEKAALADGSNQFKCTATVEIERNGRSLTWYVPLKMGDGQTEDLWYPYVFWKRDACGQTNPLQAGRKRVFQGLYPEEERCWLVHADELREGDQIYFAPATFDFEWLDTNARRFEIAYEDCGQRHSRPSRPYLLDDLDRLEALWDTMKNLNITQRYQVIRTIEDTRQKWYGQDGEQESRHDPVFRQFVADTLAGAAWPKTCSWTDIEPAQQKKLIEAGVKGELADLAELHMAILKESGGKERWQLTRGDGICL